jgi:DNA-binding transcriptional regulator YiaG
MILDRQIIARLIAEAYRSAGDAERVRRLALEALSKLGYNADCAIAGLLWRDYRIAALVLEPLAAPAPAEPRSLHPLRQARVSKHLSQREVAAVAGLTPQRLNNIEHRRAAPTEAELAALRLTLAKQPEDIVVEAARLAKRRARAAAE